MTETKALFDFGRALMMKLRVAGGVKEIRLRFPTDEEWADRHRRRKIVIKNLGRGVSETSIPGAEEVDADLVAKVRTSPDPEIDQFEAARIVEQISQAEVEDVQTTGDVCRVEMRVLGGTTIHELKVPSAKDVHEFKRAFTRVRDLPFNKQEAIIYLPAAEPVYGRLLIGTEGYAPESAIPIIHQASVVKAACDAYDLLQAPDPN